MNSEESKNLSTQFSRHEASDRLNFEPIDPVTQLDSINVKAFSKSEPLSKRDDFTGKDWRTHVFQHLSVNSCIEACIFALACSCSKKEPSSFYSIVEVLWGKNKISKDEPMHGMV